MHQGGLQQAQRKHRDLLRLAVGPVSSESLPWEITELALFRSSTTCRPSCRCRRRRRAEQLVHARAAEHDVVAATTVDRVVARPAVELLGALAAAERVVAVAPGHGDRDGGGQRVHQIGPVEASTVTRRSAAQSH